MTNLEIKQTIADYFKSQPVSKAWLFGSFARGDQRSDSDVDILISFIPGTKLGLKFFGMIIDLEDRLQRPVDLVVEGDLLPFAKKTADIDKILIYERGN
ncbi:MAG: nucleotidyltransferase family protein [Prevotella sp.]|nr:nucleotidyltransferase family protein [Prevotella sp.]MBR5653623.1 nucleotidyltransferase family protein [Prevotella sp.]